LIQIAGYGLLHVSWT